jgi:hypothetical protein
MRRRNPKDGRPLFLRPVEEDDELPPIGFIPDERLEEIHARLQQARENCRSRRDAETLDAAIDTLETLWEARDYMAIRQALPRFKQLYAADRSRLIKIVRDRGRGFDLSYSALARLGVDEDDARTIPRDDPTLVAVVEELGEDADGSFSRLEVVEWPASVPYQIVREYDGPELVDIDIGGLLKQHEEYMDRTRWDMGDFNAARRALETLKAEGVDLMDLLALYVRRRRTLAVDEYGF